MQAQEIASYSEGPTTVTQQDRFRIPAMRPEDTAS